jgi:hypothetical protein
VWNEVLKKVLKEVSNKMSKKVSKEVSGGMKKLRLMVLKEYSRCRRS